MTSQFFKDLFNDAESGVSGAAIPAADDLDVVVTRADPLAQSSMIFLTLTVQNGPSAGKDSDVGLYFPKEGSKRGARVFFAKKVAGLLSYPDVKAAFQAADNAPSVEAGFASIANALLGKAVKADLGLRSDGEYAGSNELKATRPPAGAFSQPAAAPAAPPAAPPNQVTVDPAAQAAQAVPSF